MKKKTDEKIQLEMGKRLKKIRKEKGLTQQALGDILGYSGNMINMIEHGIRPISVEASLLAEKHLRVPSAYLLCESDIESLEEYHGLGPIEDSQIHSFFGFIGNDSYFLDDFQNDEIDTLKGKYPRSSFILFSFPFKNLVCQCSRDDLIASIRFIHNIAILEIERLIQKNRIVSPREVMLFRSAISEENTTLYDLQLHPEWKQLYEINNQLNEIESRKKELLKQKLAILYGSASGRGKLEDLSISIKKAKRKRK